MKRFLCGLLTGILLLTLTACGRISNPIPQAEEQSETVVVDLPTETPIPSAEPTVEPVAEPSNTPLLREIEPSDIELVCVTDYIPDLNVELRYATPNNFTGQTIYDFTDAWLRYGTVKKLATVQNALKVSGYCLKIWDAYRPSDAQFRLWDVVPDASWVANPYTGLSSHSNGGTVDLTMVYLDGSFLEMPTDFDAFSPQADRDYSDVSDEARGNAEFLEQAMSAAGFVGYSGEWWHFSDTDSYLFDDLEQLHFSLNRQASYEPDCEEYISLRAAPDYDAEVLARVPRGTLFSVLGWIGDFVRIEYQGQQGYVAVDYIKLHTA